MFGNKQMRTEEKIFGELHKKLKKSKNFACEIKGNTETYILDTVNLEFNVTASRLTVKDKTDNVVVDIDCGFDALSEIQSRRFSWFSHFIGAARMRANKDKMHKATAKVQIKAKSKEVDDVLKSLQKIKSL